MTDPKDQIITSMDPTIETNALRAIRFVAITIALCVALPVYVLAFGLLFGGLGALFSSATGLLAFCAAVTWSANPMAGETP